MRNVEKMIIESNVKNIYGEPIKVSCTSLFNGKMYRLSDNGDTLRNLSYLSIDINYLKLNKRLAQYVTGQKGLVIDFDYIREGREICIDCENTVDVDNLIDTFIDTIRQSYIDLTEEVGKYSVKQKI